MKTEEKCSWSYMPFHAGRCLVLPLVDTFSTAEGAVGLSILVRELTPPEKRLKIFPSFQI